MPHLASGPAADGPSAQGLKQATSVLPRGRPDSDLDLLLMARGCLTRDRES